MDTKAFKTKSEIIERNMPRINGNNQYKATTIIGLDGGYSSNKGVSPNRIFTVPSYAKKAPADLEIVGKIRNTDIQFKNNLTGEVWLVGQSAETLMDQSDIDSTTDASLFTRYRYNSETYKVIMLTGMALGLWGTPPGNEIFLQTGLPATYKERDETKLIEALAGDHDIAIKVGNKDWTSFKFSLDTDHISVMEQPQGTLCSIAYTNNGETSDIGKEILTSATIILDIGFYTEDIYAIKAGYKNNHNTYSDTAMKAVLEGVIKRIQEKYPTDVKVFELQKYLEDGKIPYFDPDEFKTYQIEFGDILDEVNRELCEKSIRRLMQEYSNLTDYKYLVVTGGTGESRFKQIKEMLSGLSHLTVIPGNYNDPDLSFSYSNVLGYYRFRLAKKMKEMKN